MKTKTQSQPYDKFLDEWITAEEAAGFLKMSRRSLYQHLRNGKLDCHRFGRKIRFRRRDLNALFVKSTNAETMDSLLGKMGV